MPTLAKPLLDDVDVTPPELVVGLLGLFPLVLLLPPHAATASARVTATGPMASFDTRMAVPTSCSSVQTRRNEQRRSRSRPHMARAGAGCRRTRRKLVPSRVKAAVTA